MLFVISVSIGAVTAGTILAWTSPVLSQLQANDTNLVNGTENHSSIHINKEQGIYVYIF